MPDKFPKNRPDYLLLSRLWGIGGGIVFLTLLGYWLDQKFHTAPVLILAGAGSGVVYCIYEAWRAFKGKDF